MLPFEIGNFATIAECLDPENTKSFLPHKIHRIGNGYEVYRLVAITMYQGSHDPNTTGHFTAVLKWKGQNLLYDGLGSKLVPFETKDLVNRTPQFALYFLVPDAVAGQESWDVIGDPGIGSPPRAQLFDLGEPISPLFDNHQHNDLDAETEDNDINQYDKDDTYDLDD